MLAGKTMLPPLIMSRLNQFTWYKMEKAISWILFSFNAQ